MTQAESSRKEGKNLKKGKKAEAVKPLMVPGHQYK